VEFTLDLALVRRILSEEGRQSRDEIRQRGALAALEPSQTRLDQRIAAAADVGTLACHAGCTWCCYFSIDVRPVEVFGILDFVERSFTAEQKTRVYAEVRTNSATLKGLDGEARATRNIQCPFLQESRCTIYPVRPQSCRNYHATDVAGCRKSYEEPGNLEIDPDFAPAVYQAGVAHVEAFSSAMQDAGFDVQAYEFNGALEAALSDPSARTRFESGSRPFMGLDGDEVPLEFDDLE
jgi:Fe-S-cluster containining protein